MHISYRIFLFNLPPSPFFYTSICDVVYRQLAAALNIYGIFGHRKLRIVNRGLTNIVENLQYCIENGSVLSRLSILSQDLRNGLQEAIAITNGSICIFCQLPHVHGNGHFQKRYSLNRIISQSIKQ